MSEDTDGHGSVRVLLAALGGPDYRGLAASFETVGEEACDIVLRAAAGDFVGQFGAPRAHGRAVHENFNEVLCVAASQWPQRFAELVAADPRLSGHNAILWALGWADCDLSARLLLDAARVKVAGEQYRRWTALMSLDRLANPALPDLLTSLVKDRAALIRGAAVSIAIGYGDARLIPHLHRIALADRTPPGTRAAAWDAIDAIKIREGLAEAPVGPHTGRLIPLYRPPGDEPVRVLALERVLATTNIEVYSGQLLALLEVGGKQVPVRAPHDGLIVSILVAAHRPAPPVLAWIRAHAQL